MAKPKATVIDPPASETLQPEIRLIPLSDIFASPSNPRRHIDDKKLEELSKSIQLHGVIQAVTVRPKLDMAGKYELVCGERRWLASEKAGRQNIPCSVRELSDDQVLDLQFAENLDREDVHPMDEAVTFKAMIETGRYTTTDVAAKIAKSEAFVAQRLSLNSLIPEFQKDFWEDKFLVGHAILFSRLAVKDQKELYKQYGGRRNYDTLSETKDYIDRNVIRKLSSAPFKRDDAQLLPAAGPCTTCLKRSGCNASLFADYSEDDRCFDQACYQQKLEAFVIQKVKSTIETKPEILLVDSNGYGDKVAPAIKKLASEMKVEIIEQNFNTVSSHKVTGSVPVKVLMVSGSEAGKLKTMYAKSKKTKTAAGVTSGPKTSKRTAEHVQDDIDALKARQYRALQLDSEKVWEKINDDLLDDPSDFPFSELTNPAHSDDERLAMAIALIGKMDDPEYEYKAFQILKFKDVESMHDFDVKDLPRFKVTYDQLRALQRLFMISVLRGGKGYLTEVDPFLLMKVLKEMPSFKKPVQDLEDAQSAEAAKRIASAAKRMAALEKEKKELEGKKPDKAPAKKGGGAKPATAPKRSAGKGKKKDLKDLLEEGDSEELAPDFSLGDDEDFEEE